MNVVDRVTVLVIEQNAAEATLVAAALALRPEVRVLDAGDAGKAVKRLKKPAAPVVLAIAGSAALSSPPSELFTRLGAQGIPIVGIGNLSAVDKGRALKAGVQEVHDRPAEWRSYAELIESLVSRYMRP